MLPLFLIRRPLGERRLKLSILIKIINIAIKRPFRNQTKLIQIRHLVLTRLPLVQPPQILLKCEKRRVTFGFGGHFLVFISFVGESGWFKELRKRVYVIVVERMGEHSLIGRADVFSQCRFGNQGKSTLNLIGPLLCQCILLDEMTRILSSTALLLILSIINHTLHCLIRLLYL